MKILLIFPRWTNVFGIFGHWSRTAAPIPPLGLTMIAALAEKEGHEVCIIDAEAEQLSTEDVIRRAKDFNPNIIGLTGTTPFFHITKELAANIKKEMPEKIVVVGGSHITILKQEVFDACFDYGFVGEADVSWVEFLKEMSSYNPDFFKIKGMIFRKNGEMVFTGSPDFIVKMDDLPIPSRHLLNPNLYKMGTRQGTRKCTSLMTVRGCPFSCIYCSTEIFGKKVRKRSPELVIKEIQKIVEQGYTHLMLLDDTATIDKRHFMDICNLIISNNIKITWEISTRANLVDEELMSTMKKAGVIRIFFGLEVVNERIREIIHKNIPMESYKIANLLGKKYNIETCNNCMIGLPGETRETIQETIDYLKNAREITQSNINIVVPYPGTELYRMAKNKEMELELITDDFSKYRRFNTAVMKVGSLSPQDLVEIQNKAYISTYFLPWRLYPMLKRSGVKSLLLITLRIYKHIVFSIRKLINK